MLIDLATQPPPLVSASSMVTRILATSLVFGCSPPNAPSSTLCARRAKRSASASRRTMEGCEVVERGADVGVIGAQRFFADRNRALVEGLGQIDRFLCV